MSWINPKTDWVTNPTNPVPADFNRIEGNISQLNTDVSTGKTNIFNAIVAKGITPVSNAFSDLVTAIGNIIRSLGTATAAQVLTGYTFGNNLATNVPGTMPNNGAPTLTSSMAVQNITAGYYSGGTIQPIPETAGDNIFAASDASARTTATVYTKVKEIKILKASTVRVKFDFVQLTMGTGYARIYKNGVAFGTERSQSNSQVVDTFTQDLSFAANDLIQIYVKSSGYEASCSNFRLCTSLPTIQAQVNL